MMVYLRARKMRCGIKTEKKLFVAKASGMQVKGKVLLNLTSNEAMVPTEKKFEGRQEAM